MLNTLISLYSKCGDTETARSIFEGMGSRRDLVSWSAMVSCYANNNMERQAICTFLDMLELGFYPERVLLYGHDSGLLQREVLMDWGDNLWVCVENRVF